MKFHSGQAKSLRTKISNRIFEFMVNEMSIVLTKQNFTTVKTYLATGKFKDPNHVIETALILLQEHEEKVAYMKEAIRVGEESGIAEDFSFDKFIDEMKAEKVLIQVSSYYLQRI